MMRGDVRVSDDPKHQRIVRLTDLYLRSLSIVLLLFGIVHWMVIIGLFDDPAWRFSSMKNYWQAATIILGVTDLVAGVGLWMRVGWGIAMWGFVALFEVVIRTAFQHSYGFNPLIVLFHLATVSAYFALVLAERRSRPAR